MKEETILMVIMGSLIIIEIGLIWSIHKLIKTLENMTAKVSGFNERFSGLSYMIERIKDAVKNFGSGKIEVKGKNPFTGSDMNIELEMKKK